MNDIEHIRDILERAIGERSYDVEYLASVAYDIIKGDRTLIKILGRNIESLTMQMKAITQVTFERDNLQEAIEVYKERIEYFRERLKQYEES